MLTRRTLLLTVAGLWALPRLSVAQELRRGAPLPGVLNVANPLNKEHPLARGLRAWWLFLPQRSGGGTAWYDLRQNFPATLTSMTSPPTATGGWGRATRRSGGLGEIRWEGTMQAAATPVKWLDAIPAFTWSVWARRTTVAVVGGLFSKFPSTSIQTSLFTFSDGFLYFRIKSSASGGDVALDLATRMPVGVWTHLAAVYDGTLTGNIQRGKIYLNGTLSPFINAGGVVPALTDNHDVSAGSTVPLVLGRYLDTTATSWVGALDDLRVYTRALSAMEIKELYSNSRLGYPGLLRQIPLSTRGNPATTTTPTRGHIL